MFYGHSTAIVITGRPRERGRMHLKPTSEFTWLFNVSILYTLIHGTARLTSLTMDVSREKCLAKGHNSIPQWRTHRGLNPGNPDSQSSMLTTMIFWTLKEVYNICLKTPSHHIVRSHKLRIYN